MAADFTRLKTFFSDDIQLPAFLKQKHIPSLDGLRAFAIVYVLVAHSNFDACDPYVGTVFAGGTLGVLFFFSISGFLITSLLLKEKISTGSISLKNFYLRRFLRIMPVYILAVMVIFVLDKLLGLGIAARFYIFVLTFTENYDTRSVWYLRHFWSLSAEMQFYFLFPFIMRKSLNFYIKFALLLIATLPVITFFAYHPQYVSPPFRPIVNGVYMFFSTGIISILIGSIAAIILFKFPLQPGKPVPLLSFLQVAILILIWRIDGSSLFVTELARDILISLFVVSIVCFRDPVFYRLLNNRVVKAIGLLSYSLYVWQQLFTYHQPWANSFKYGSSLWFNLPVLMLVAYLSYHYFEKPFLKLKTRFAK